MKRPVFKNAEVFNKAIAGSKLILLEGRGHEIHYNDWDIIVRAVEEHTK